MSNNDYAMRVSSDNDEGIKQSSSSSSSTASASHSPAEPSSSSGWAAFLAKETKAQATSVAAVANTQNTAPGNTALHSAVDISNNNNDRTSSSPAQAVTSATTNSTGTTKVKLSFGLPAFALPQTHVPTRTTPLPPTIPSTASQPPVNAPSVTVNVKQGEESKPTVVAKPDANMAVKAAVEEEKTDAHVTTATTTDQPARQEEQQQQLCDNDSEGLLQQVDALYEAKLSRASSSLATATTTNAPDFDVALITELLQLTRQTLNSDAVSQCASNDAAALKTLPASSTAQNTTQDDKTQATQKTMDDYRTAMLARLGLQKAVVEEWSWTGVTADVPTSAEGGNNTASRRQTSEKRGTWPTPLQSYSQADLLRCDKDDEQSSTESDDVAPGEAAMPAEVLTVLQLEQRQRRSDEVQHEQLSDILRAA